MKQERNLSPDLGLGTTVLAAMGAAALVAILFLLSPWNVSYIANRSALGTMSLVPLLVFSSQSPVQGG